MFHLLALEAGGFMRKLQFLRSLPNEIGDTDDVREPPGGGRRDQNGPVSVLEDEVGEAEPGERRVGSHFQRTIEVLNGRIVVGLRPGLLVRPGLHRNKACATSRATAAGVWATFTKGQPG